MDFPKRKSNRLKGYNYGDSGRYFITICTKERNKILWKNPVGACCARPFCARPFQMPLLSEIGLIVDNEINTISQIYDGVIIDKYVIMPNHIHMIIILQCDGNGENGRPKVAPTVSRIIQQFKGSITKKIGYSIWQKSFHDHIIVTDQEYNKICEYIDMNPSIWIKDYFY